MKPKVILVTGAAGFIGFHLCNALIKKGFYVLGIDALTDYYDVSLKLKRLEILKKSKYFEFSKLRIDTDEFLEFSRDQSSIDIIVHLAAQAGVRYSIEHPREYVDTNLIGTFNLLEFAKNARVSHMLMASTSSVYGANKNMPFYENQKCDGQMSFYAATKKANEVMAHSYSHIHEIPITVFRFFIVYGPWGRPDMALFKFADSILKGKPIEVYNFGNMKRDFTYVEDLAEAITRLLKVIPDHKITNYRKYLNDSLSKVAPYRIVNIGNSTPVKLMDYILALENALGLPAAKEFLPMQPGDVPETFANTELLKSLIGYAPSTSVEDGVAKFVEWFKDYRQIK